MNLADKPCYSQRKLDSTGKPYGFITGLTFRERLIIALASNNQVIENAWDDDGMPTMNTDKDALGRNATSIINQADAIIAEMQK